MNWLIKLSKRTIASLSGEYWIIDGHSTFADGDVGDTNHDGVVWQHLSYVIEEVELPDNLQNAIDNNLLSAEEMEDIDEEYPGLFSIHNGNYNAYSDEQAKWDRILNSNFDPSEQMVIEHEWPGYLSYKGMPKDYAVEHLGWIRVLGSNFEVQNVNNDNLSDIVGHVYEQLYDAPEDFEICINEQSTGAYICIEFSILAEKVSAGTAEGYYRMKHKRDQVEWY